MRYLVDGADLVLTKDPAVRHVAPMPKSHKRPPRRPPLLELIRVRRMKYPHMMQVDFAKRLGITRLHMTAIEMGRRTPSTELALRWLALLAPQARLDMFGPLPVIEQRLDLLKQLQKFSPKTRKAA